MTADFTEFKFDPASLSAPRPPGISAYMRVKNEERFVRLAIESHLPFYDEIVAVYNDCTDATPQILHDLAAKYPQKIKVFHYLPKVIPLASKEHTQTPTESVHSMANYSNYVLSQCSYRVAVKLDADHLAIPCKLTPLIKTIRADMAADKLKVYTFSGINLIRDQADNLTVSPNPHRLYSGNGDIFYHQIHTGGMFYQRRRHEHFEVPDKKPPHREYRYMGIVYFHLKWLKKEFIEPRYEKGISFVEFATPNYQRFLRQQLTRKDRLLCTLYDFAVMQRVRYKLIGKPPKVRHVRLTRLADDLHGIDFERDALQWLL